MATHAALKARQRLERHTHSPSVTLRVHRALSWLGRAEKENHDEDARFVFLWIAFNAAYATGNPDPRMTEKQNFRDFLRTLIDMDTEGALGNLIWREFSGSIRLLLKNEFVFRDFWHHHNGLLTATEWEERFRKSRRTAELALARGDTLKVLSILMSRLYVLRNQLLHGGATWNGAVNRAQVRDCANLLGKLVPIVIKVMMDHPAHDWGAASYPVVNTEAQSKRLA
jgi:hypothetical protein